MKRKKRLMIFFCVLVLVISCPPGWSIDITDNFKLGIQLTNDFSFLSFPRPKEDYSPGNFDPDIEEEDLFIEDLEDSSSEYLAKRLNFVNTYWIRFDISLNANITDTTHFDYLMALRILALDSGVQENFSYTILQCEIGQDIGPVTLKIGRLAEKFSESRFFGRLALGEDDAHVFGRTPFVNDAVEFMLLKDIKNLTFSFYTGAKFVYMPLDFAGYYAITDISVPLGKKDQFKFDIFGIYSLNRQFEKSLEVLFPSADKDNYFHGVEGEVALTFFNMVTAFANIGFWVNYQGYMPHCSGPRDILRLNAPIIDDKTNSLGDSLIPCVGIKVTPGIILTNKKKGDKEIFSLDEITLEAEVLGIGYEGMYAFNIYGHIGMSFFDTLFISYGLSFNIVRFKEDTTLSYEDSAGEEQVALSTDRLGMATHYIRISVSF
jgi:hypothetical protein